MPHSQLRRDCCHRFGRGDRMISNSTRSIAAVSRQPLKGARRIYCHRTANPFADEPDALHGAPLDPWAAQRITAGSTRHVFGPVPFRLYGCRLPPHGFLSPSTFSLIGSGSYPLAFFATHTGSPAGSAWRRVSICSKISSICADRASFPPKSSSTI